MKILEVTPLMPYPLKSGGQVRIYRILERLARRHEVVLCTYVMPGEEVWIGELERICRRVVPIRVEKARRITGKFKRLFNPLQWHRHFARLRLLAGGTPVGVANLYDPGITRKIQRLVEDEAPDVVEITFCQMGHLIPRKRGSRPVNVLVDIDLAVTTAERIAHIAHGSARARAMKEACRLRAWCARTLPTFDAVVAMSEMDAAKLEEMSPSTRTLVVPNGVDISYYALDNQQRDGTEMLYIGGTGHTPNVDALNYFAEMVFPTIKARIGGARLTVVGESDTDLLPLLRDDPTVRFVGFVEDIRPWLQEASLMVVPLRIGGGTRLKILEAMAAGLPVVSTPVGCEGIDVVPLEHIAVAADEWSFAEETVRLLGAPECGARMAANARALVEERYSWERITADYERRLLALLEEGGSDGS